MVGDRQGVGREGGVMQLCVLPPEQGTRQEVARRKGLHAARA
jgi:hypothetical protein